jgi:acetyl esterase/lipase
MNKRILVLAIILIFTVNLLKAQHYDFEKQHVVYKKVDGSELEMIIYKPLFPGVVKLPALVFFFGGGWVSGTPDHFKLQAEYFASRGMITICPDYRTKSRHGTSPFESVKDAKSVMRFLKKQGNTFGIDTSLIVAAGGSAGGHLAACTAIIKNINEETDDLSVSAVPHALVLFNPVVDTSKKGYGQEKVSGREFEISPVHHITPGLPPTLIMHGKNDITVPFENVVRFKHTMKQEGNECTLVGYRKQAHGFFNYNKKPKYFKKTVLRTEGFLEDLNLLKGTSWVKQFYRELKD